jgi:hypothetical protein
MIVEVFKTNVNYLLDAELLVRQIESSFPSYSASFDLEDCDRILRVESRSGFLKNNLIIDILKYNNFSAEVLKDEIVVKTSGISKMQF